MIIDTHVHIIVPELLWDAAPEETWRPRVLREGGRQVIEWAGRRITSALHEFVSVEGILETSRAMGMTHVLLSPWANLLRSDAPADEARRTAEILNESLTQIARHHPGQISVLGSVALADPAQAGRDVAGLMRRPGMRGVEVPASVAGVCLGDDRFRPFWEAAEDAGALVFVHPTTHGFNLAVLTEYYLWNAVGNPLETTITAAQMVMAGVMEAHPRLRVLLAHGGGAILALRGRLRHAHAIQPAARVRLRESPEDSLRRFFYDTVTHDAGLLRALVAYAGADHVMLGTDYPFDMGLADPIAFVRSAGLSPAEEARVLGGTAAELLGLTPVGSRV
ncbi:MAG TPA: amidohydrolase family protein [bacterium]